MATIRNQLDIVQDTFGNDRVLVGMLDPKKTPAAGYYVAPNTITQTLTTTACAAQVASSAFKTRYLWTPVPSEKSVVCVLTPSSTFDETTPSQPINAYRYSAADKHYVSLDLKNLEQEDKALWALQEIYSEALKNFQTLLAGPPSSARDQAFAEYAVARKNFDAALQYREYEVEHDDANESKYSEHFVQAQAFANAHSEEALFASLAPQTTAPLHETKEEKATRCMFHYRAMATFFQNQGVYASPATREQLLGSAIFNLHDALQDAPLTKSQFQSDTQSYLDFHTLLRQYSHPLSDHQFKEAITKFLFDPKQKEPSEALKRAVMNNPAQMKKLEQMADVKRDAIEKVKKHLLKRAVKTTILTMYQLQNAIESMLSDHRFMGVEEIIRKALRKSDTWIPSRPFEDFLPDDCKDLGALTALAGRTPEEAAARTLALQQIAYRVRRHAEQAFATTIEHRDLSLEACLLRAQQARSFNESSGYYFNAAEASLQTNVYGRLQRLGTMEHNHPEQGMFLWRYQPGYAIHSDYVDAQKAVQKKIFGAANNLFTQLDTLAHEPIVQSPGVFNHRYASLPDDISRLETSLPSLFITPPGRATEERDYPDMPKINKLKPQVRALATHVQSAIETHRRTYPINTAALRREAMVPTTAEIRGLLAAFANLALNAPTLAINPKPKITTSQGNEVDATTILQQAKTAATLASDALQKIVKLDPTLRADHMRLLYETFDALKTLFAHNITTDDHVRAVHAACETASLAAIALQNAVNV